MRKPSLMLLCYSKKGLTLPALTRFVQGMDDVEGVWVLLLELFKLFTEKDIAFLDIGKDERELGLIVLFCQSILENLPHGCTRADRKM